MRYFPTSRRMFLTGLGGVALALPLLPSLLPRALRSVAEADGGSSPKRFVAIKTYNGMPIREFYPSRAPAGYGTHDRDGTVRLSTRLTQATGNHGGGGGLYYATTAPLADFATNGLGNILGTEFNRLHDDMIFLRGLDFTPDLNHNHGGFLGNLGLRTNGVGGALPGAQINATIDYVMAASLAVYPTAPMGPRVLHVGSRRNTCSYAPRNPDDVLATGAGAVDRAQAYVDPRAAFAAAFPSGMSGGGTTTPMQPGISARMIDRVREDYRRAAGSPHLSAQDRMTLDRHLTYLTELEARLSDRPPVAACASSSGPTALDTGGEFDVEVDNVRQLWRDMVDVIVLALSCDSTRIVTLDISKVVVPDGGGEFGMGDSEDPGSAGRSNWHLQEHNWDDNAIRWITSGVRWAAQEVVLTLLDRMKEIQETGGTSLLYNSFVLWGNEFGFNHIGYSVPTTLFGHGGGYLRTGQYLDYTDHDRPVRFMQKDGSVIEGVQYNRLLVTLMQGMGLRPEEYETTPGQGFGEFRTIGKNDAWAISYDTSNVGQVLPGMTTG